VLCLLINASDKGFFFLVFQKVFPLDRVSQAKDGERNLGSLSKVKNGILLFLACLVLVLVCFTILQRKYHKVFGALLMVSILVETVALKKCIM